MKGKIDRQFRHPAEGRVMLWLEAQGHGLLRHNYHTGFSEIDLITCKTPDELHFIEVKSWSSSELRHPLESFTTRRQNLIRRAAQGFLYELSGHSQTKKQIRDTGITLWPGEPMEENFTIGYDLVWEKGNRGEIELFEDVF